jgi:hypothetical protein
MEDTSTERPRETDKENGVIEPRVIDHDLLAKLVIRDGKPFKQSALEVGYSIHVAAGGLKRLMSESTPVTEAVKREWERINGGLDRMKPMAVKRLFYEIADVNSPFGMRAIEIAGKFRETDWFVRSTEMQLGVLINLAEQSPQTEDSDEFKE